MLILNTLKIVQLVLIRFRALTLPNSWILLGLMKELATHFQIEGSLVYIFRVKASISSEFMLSLDQEVERRCGLDDNLRLLLKPKSFEIASKVHL